MVNPRRLTGAALCLLGYAALQYEWHLYAFDWWLDQTTSTTTTGADASAPIGLFYWISTREGLTSRFNQLELLYSQLSARNRTLVVVDNPSVHYKDLPTIRLCDIFVLPSPGISCTSISANVIVRRAQCLMQNRTEQNHLVQGFAVRRGYAGRVARVSDISWDSPRTTCGLLYGYNFPLHVAAAKPLRVTLVPRYWALLQTMLDHLGAGFQSHEYVAVHWRRGDQRQRCAVKSILERDETVNCGSAADLVATVEGILTDLERRDAANATTALPPRRRKVYIATNENDPETLAALSHRGYKLFRDAFVPGDAAFPRRTAWRPGGLSSLDVFVLELLVMAESGFFFGWGPTGVRGFVERIRRERLTG